MGAIIGIKPPRAPFKLVGGVYIMTRWQISPIIPTSKTFKTESHSPNKDAQLSYGLLTAQDIIFVSCKVIKINLKRCIACFLR